VHPPSGGAHKALLIEPVSSGVPLVDPHAATVRVAKTPQTTFAKVFIVQFSTVAGCSLPFRRSQEDRRPPGLPEEAGFVAHTFVAASDIFITRPDTRPDRLCVDANLPFDSDP
jgi:hypothetical protein